MYHLDVSNYYVYFYHEVLSGLGRLQLQSLISFFPQSLYWPHTWPQADPSQAVSVTLWLMGAQWASIKQRWSAALWASTPVQQPDTADEDAQVRSSSEHWKKRKASREERQLFLQWKLSAGGVGLKWIIRDWMFIISHLDSYLGSKLSAVFENWMSVKLTCITSCWWNYCSRF